MDIYLDKENMVMFISLNMKIQDKETVEKLKAGLSDDLIYQVVVVENIENIFDV
ncbi:hypothetical protein [Staphylococcus xylosus]|uniref:hypothetical protein n=1 Tax=Staphylococcus xylosus TaxID=1288 RepID=UPI001304B00E|nr:hypothetical protein [Staphylococcus xylosus]